VGFFADFAAILETAPWERWAPLGRISRRGKTRRLAFGGKNGNEMGTYMAREETMSAAAKTKTPWHLWAVGVVGLIWNGYGAFDYFMTMTKGDAYMQSAGMTAEQIEHLNAMPFWMTAVWATGVWGAVLGTLLLLLRNKLAVPVFFASLAAFVTSVVYSVFVEPAPHGGAMSAWIMHAVIFAGCVFFLWYSMRARKQGLLR
jgi:hypothetical protein